MGKEPTCQCRRRKRPEFDPWVGKIPWRRAWQPTPILAWRIPKDRGAWWATVHSVTQSQARLKQLSTKHVSTGGWPMFLVPCPWQSGGRPAVLTVTAPPPLLTILPSCCLVAGNSFTTWTWTTINRVLITTEAFRTARVSSWAASFREQDSFRLSLLPFLMPASGRAHGYKTVLRNSQCLTVSYSRSAKVVIRLFSETVSAAQFLIQGQRRRKLTSSI